MKSFGVYFSALAIMAASTLTNVEAGLSGDVDAKFPYQGALQDNGVPADGTYDFEFNLFDNIFGGTQIGSTLAVDDVEVVNGVFNVELDFGSEAFTAGERRFLEISVAPDNGTFETLDPRIQLFAVPLATFALNAGNVDTATNADNATTADSATTADTATTAQNAVDAVSFDAANDNTLTLTKVDASEISASLTDMRLERLFNSNGDATFAVVQEDDVLLDGTFYLGSIPQQDNDSRLEIREGTDYDRLLVLLDILGNVIFQVNADGNVGINTTPSNGDRVFIKGDDSDSSLIYVEDESGSRLFQMNPDGRTALNTPPTSSDRFVIKTTDSDSTGLVIVNDSNIPFFQVDTDGDLELFKKDDDTQPYFEVFGSDRAGGLPEGSVRFGDLFQMNADTGTYSFGGPTNGVLARIFGETGNVVTEGNFAAEGNISVSQSSVFDFFVDGATSGNTGVGDVLFNNTQLAIKATSDDTFGLFIRDDDDTDVFGVEVDNGSMTDNRVIVFQDLIVLGSVVNKNASSKTLIDHPDDPSNKTVTHQAVSGPGNVSTYSGTVSVDSSGNAVVKLPEYFEGLNGGSDASISYQLTSVGGAAPNLHVSKEVSGNTFSIGGGFPNGKVSWQVFAERQDAWAKANKTADVSNKAKDDQGKYYYPEGFGVKASDANDYRAGYSAPDDAVTE